MVFLNFAKTLTITIGTMITILISSCIQRNHNKSVNHVQSVFSKKGEPIAPLSLPRYQAIYLILVHTQQIYL